MVKAPSSLWGGGTRARRLHTAEPPVHLKARCKRQPEGGGTWSPPPSNQLSPTPRIISTRAGGLLAPPCPSPPHFFPLPQTMERQSAAGKRGQWGKHVLRAPEVPRCVGVSGGEAAHPCHPGILWEGASGREGSLAPSSARPGLGSLLCVPSSLSSAPLLGGQPLGEEGSPGCFCKEGWALQPSIALRGDGCWPVPASPGCTPPPQPPRSKFFLLLSLCAWPPPPI